MLIYALFQSSPTPKGGRYNIRIFSKILSGSPFQSSPTPKGGRYKGMDRGKGNIHCFNPRPPRKVGATSGFRCITHNNAGVSILAHPERWALPPCPELRAAIKRRFNPRPPERWALRRVLRYVYLGVEVSILAHPERWALQADGAGRMRWADVSILAHPERWALPFTAGTIHYQWTFQSSPTPKGGRYDKAIDGIHWMMVFQSSPTPKGGRYMYEQPIVSASPKVSILAHPERWALLTQSVESSLR